MTQTRDLAHHAALMDTMATRVGLDLEASILDGEVRPDDVVDAVLSCRECSAPGACEAWLATHDLPQKAPPHYCRNADLFARLTLPLEQD